LLPCSGCSVLQLLDAATCQPGDILGAHWSFITSLDASGSLLASTCSAEWLSCKKEQSTLPNAQPHHVSHFAYVVLPIPNPAAAGVQAGTCYAV
jgi:hypothetical protein